MFTLALFTVLLTAMAMPPAVRRASTASSVAVEQRAGARRPDTAVDAFLRKVMRERMIPGMQVAVIQRGRVVYRRDLGIASLEHAIRVTPQTIFPINSGTKAFTGVAIMQLVEDGLLDLEVPIARYLDSLPNAWQGLTIRQLLSHTAGLPDVMDATGTFLPGTEAEVISRVRGMPMRSTPGSEFSYNGTAYVLLARLISQRSGMPFTQFIQERQLAVVGMPLTRDVGFVDGYDVVRNSAEIYTRVGGAKPSAPWKARVRRAFDDLPPWIRAAAGMQSTADEIARWLIALQKGRLFKQTATLTTLWTPTRVASGETQGFSRLLNGYAMGWPTMSRAAHRAVGGIGGGRSAFFVYPDDDLAIVILTNLRGSAPEEFSDALAAFWIPGLRDAGRSGP